MKKNKRQPNTVHDVKIGDILTRKVISGSDDITRISTRLREEQWTVVRIYPWHVMAKRGTKRECFNYGWLVAHGYERQSSRNQALIMERQGNVWEGRSPRSY